MPRSRNPLAPEGLFEPDPTNPLAGRYTAADAADFWRQNMADTYAAVQNPQTWVDAARAYGQGMLMGSVAPGEGNILAYHGSPHSFDRFSSANIGTGEGAQAFGHGLYFAGNENVARSYRDALSANRPIWDANKGVMITPDNAYYSDYAAATPPGHMYQVNIAAPEEQFLHWDKPISEHPQPVKDALQKLGVYRPGKDDDLTGGGAYGILTSLSPGAQSLEERQAGVSRASNASLALRNAGIPGMRYLDAGSRGAGEGSHNTVVFDDNLISILRKYGIAGLFMGGGAAGAASGGQDQQQ